MTKEFVSRKQAQADGLPLYFTGKPCNLGGIAARSTSEKKCQCEVHKAKRASAANSRYEKHRDYRLKKASEWSKANTERRKKIALEWAQRNLHKVTAQTQKRRATKANATPSWFSDFDDFVLKEAHHLARLRAKLTGVLWEVDHVIPIAGKRVCGFHLAVNIRVVTRSENRRKSNKFIIS